VALKYFSEGKEKRLATFSEKNEKQKLAYLAIFASLRETKNKLTVK
jgi:hypothetical protein